MKGKRLFLLGTIWFFCLFAPTLSVAHRVNVFAWVEGDTVYTESFFSDGTKPVHSRIDVFDPEGQIVLTGKTDEEGRFSFKILEKTDLKIVLNDSMGHRAEHLLSASEMTGAVGSGYDKGHEQPPEIKQEEVLCIDKEAIRSVMEEVLDEKLGPILRKLAVGGNKGPTVSEIVGGIGYIFGLIGVALYFSNRSKTR
ncbi:MAG: hypothetical protein BA872_00935 [Desulfobacterales bacterium C00003060]|nr:MAG: hypothetical protein BA872_00935 [Desulfobacterales bacterium C00003060]